MVAIAPFRALRYNPDLVHDVSFVISPPYDVIDATQQEQLYHASPYNIVRLILGKQSPNDTEENNRYTRAQRDFAEWKAHHVLRQDATPAVYLIEHTFDDAGSPSTRLGFIALLQFGEGVERSVYRHEATLSAPKADRTKLLEAVLANLEPIFCIYPDEAGTIQAALATQTTRVAPTVQATLAGELVRVWALTDATRLQRITAHLATVSVLIADGHHRFEVAYAKRAQYGALMSYFVSMADPALRVRPIHRIVPSAAASSLSTIQELCLVERAATLETLRQWLDAATDVRGRFGYYEAGNLYHVTVKSERLAQWLMAPPVPLPLALLDVSVLHGLMLPRLGLNGHSVRYAANASEVLHEVDAGTAHAGWLLRGIPITQVYALAAQGLILPPKSTYFYPKVPSGLTIYSLI